MGYLLDTSICSQPLKRTPHMPALKRWNQLRFEDSFTSVVCLAEIEWGLHKLNSKRRWAGYQEDIIPSVCSLPSDTQVWKCWAHLKAQQTKQGHPIHDIDLLIAATAIEHNLTLATLNTRHFSPIKQLRWEDWS